MAKSTDALQGALELVVLKALEQLGAMHGFGITLHVQRGSADLLRVQEGSLYPALHRLEEAGWIASAWRTTENNRRAKYYRLTPAGKRQLAEQEKSWAQLVKGVSALLRYA